MSGGLSRDEFSDAVLRALADAMAGDMERAAERLRVACPTPKDGFAACCGMANIVVKVASDRSPGNGPIITELSIIPGATPTDAERSVMSDLAAFLAAVGNSDFQGAWTVFDEACCGEDPERGGEFMASMIGIAVACAKSVEP